MNKSKLGRFIRRQLYCRSGIHFDIEYFDPIARICGERKCKDCGEIFPSIKWPQPPPCKPPKLNCHIAATTPEDINLSTMHECWVRGIVEKQFSKSVTRHEEIDVGISSKLYNDILIARNQDVANKKLSEGLIDFVDASEPVAWIEVTPKTLRRLRALKDDNERCLVKVNHVLPEINTLLGYKIVINDQADGVEMHIQTSKHDAPCIKRLLI